VLVLLAKGSRGWHLLLTFALLAGCAKTLDTETPTKQSTKAGVLLRDCVVPMPGDVVSWTTPATVAYPDGVLWIFPSVNLSDGALVRGAATWLASADAACAGPPELLRKPDGSLASLLALNGPEVAANASRTDGRSFALVPQAGFSDAGVGYLYYDHVLIGPGASDPDLVGTGVCVLDIVAGTCARAVDANGSTVLWIGDDLPVRSAFVEAGTAYLLACRQPASLMQSCTLARVSPSGAATPSAYQYFDAFQGWVASRAQGTQVLSDLAEVSLSCNPFLARYVVLLTDPFGGKVSLRTSVALDQSFGNLLPLFTAAASSPDSWIDGGAEQTSLRGEDGRVIHMLHGAGSSAARELHFASYRFDQVVE